MSNDSDVFDNDHCIDVSRDHGRILAQSRNPTAMGERTGRRLLPGSIYSGPFVLRLHLDFMIVSSDCETLWALPTDDRVCPMMTYEPCDVAVNTVYTFSMVCICI